MEVREQEKETSEPDLRLERANKLYQTGVLLIYGKRKVVDKAIKCIQKAITFDDSNYTFWQLLGEAYYQRGSLNPAINCFMKSLQLAESNQTQTNDERRLRADCTHSRLRMSDIRLFVGHLDEAAVGYSDIIAQDPDNVAALVGLSKVKLQMARDSFFSGLVVSGHSYCMQALRYSLRAIKLRPHICLTLKLASDCCLIQFIYGQRGQFETIIDEQFPGADETGLKVTRTTCIELAQQFLCKALSIEPFQESGCLWHNLGVSLYLKSTVTRDPIKRRSALEISIKSLLRALNYDRKNSQIRNSIGVVAFQLNLLNSSQNFLIRSIQTNMSTSEVQFSNLGYIYLQRGEFSLASIAFNRCQAEEPLYARSWLGNALVREHNNEDNMNYLRHCHKLDNNYESQLLFATKVSSSHDSTETKRDIINALDSMKRTINYDHRSLEACNTLALLFERVRHMEQAKLFFDKAYKLCENDPRIVFNKLRQHRTNDTCSPMIGPGSSPDDAEFIKMAEKLASSGNREYVLNYIFYLFNNRDFKSVNSKMTRLIDKLDDVKNKIGAQIVLGLAAKSEGGDYKSWFFKNIIDSEGNTNNVESLINLLCLMILGSSSGDEQLVEQVSDDIAKLLPAYIHSRRIPFESLLCSTDGYWIRLTIFCSLFCLNNQSKLIRPLLALFPNIAELWLHMGLSLMFIKSKQQSAIFCIKKAHLICCSDADLNMICDILLAIMTQTVKSKQVKLDTKVNYLSRSVHKYPNYELLWRNLTLARETRDKLGKNLASSDDLLNLAIDHVLASVIS